VVIAYSIDHCFGRRHLAYCYGLGLAKLARSRKGESEPESSPLLSPIARVLIQVPLPPQQILSGHDKGILSLSWCAQDSDLLLSCGKDNRTICWNPQSCEIVGELPSSDNWSFQTAWCPRNPDLIATASFDGKIGIHSLQNTHENHNEAGRSANKTNTSNNPDDIFGSQPGEESSSATVLSLKQPPKWLRPPVSVAFGFGGQLASVNGGVVSLQSVVTEQDVIERAKTLAGAIDSQEELGSFCEDMAKKEGGDASAVAGWKALKSLFTTNSRDELVTLLGFSKGEIAHQVSEAIKKFKLTIKTEGEDESEVKTPKEGAVTFAEPGEMEETADGASTPKAESEADGKGISTPSEVSATTDATKKTEAETEMTEHSLFDEDNRIGTPQFDTGAGANFFSSIGQLRNALPDHMQVPHQAYAKDSSVAATIGSRASSVASETMKSNTFKIYPSNESEVDRLITRALVVGDFESAVTLCLSVDRFADALVLAVRGGPDLLAKTQQAYFEKRTTALPYLRLFQSIVSEDLSDVVQNADLTEWQEVFVVLCTFARADEFNGLTEQLGQRIEFQSRMVNGSNDQANSDRAKELRKNALLCYLAAGRLEKAVNIWVEEMREDEDTAVNGAGSDGTKASRYTAHAQALQTFMEKVAVFRSATNYVDRDLAQPTQAVSAAESGARTYSLAALYDRYYEYADLLATQGQTQLAVKYVQQTPAGYKGSKGDEAGPTSVRARYMLGAGLAEQKPAQASTSAFVPTPAQKPPAPSNPAFGIQQPFAPVQEIQQPPLSAAPSAYSPYVPAQPSQPAQTGPSSSTNPYAPSNPYGASNSPYGPGPSTYTPATNNYGQYGGQQPRASAGPVAPPPMARPRQNDSPGPVPAAQRRDIPGWNDAPSMQPKRTGSAPGKPQPIMSPFPEGQSPIVPAQSPMGYQQPNQQPGQFAPPPQREQGAAIPPPPRGAQPPRPASAQPPPPPPAANQAQYTQAKPMSPPMRAGPPPGAIAGPPPARAMSPLVPPQHRVMSPPAPQQQQYMQPPAPQAQAPSQGSYQPPPGARAGPPPPGRAPSQMGNASSSRPASVAPPTKAAPKYRKFEMYEIA
jgi:protein transport protein SEC31